MGEARNQLVCDAVGRDGSNASGHEYFFPEPQVYVICGGHCLIVKVQLDLGGDSVHDPLHGSETEDCLCTKPTLELRISAG